MPKKADIGRAHGIPGSVLGSCPKLTFAVRSSQHCDSWSPNTYLALEPGSGRPQQCNKGPEFRNKPAENPQLNPNPKP